MYNTVFKQASKMFPPLSGYRPLDLSVCRPAFFFCLELKLLVLICFLKSVKKFSNGCRVDTLSLHPPVQLWLWWHYDLCWVGSGGSCTDDASFLRLQPSQGRRSMCAPLDRKFTGDSEAFKPTLKAIMD